jgi:hypothetical protein
LYQSESRNIGGTVLSGILYRIQCIKVSRLIEAKSKGVGGQRWIGKFYKTVFEKKMGFENLSRNEKEKKWEEEAMLMAYEKDRKENRWLVQSKNRLMKLYDLVKFLIPFFFVVC